MRIFLIIITILLNITYSFGQKGKLIEKKAFHFSLFQKKDTIDFIVVDTVLSKKKPIFLWCQGSLPVPLFFEYENPNTQRSEYIFQAGGIANFDYKRISQAYHLVVISMPKTPVLVSKEHLNNRYCYIPDKEKPDEMPEYVAADYLENYVNRANTVLKFLKKQKWVANGKIVVAGHSQGTKVATKIAASNKSVTHLGLFSANPFGRIDQFIREPRLDAQLGKITWEQADSNMVEYYELYKAAHHPDSLRSNLALRAWKSFSETYYDDWLDLHIPIYLAYGTEDRTADLCDLVPLFFIAKQKNNLSLKRYLHLEHNFMEVDKDGKVDYEKAHWEKVMNEFLDWIKS